MILLINNHWSKADGDRILTVMFLVKLFSLLAVALMAGGWMMGTMLIVPAQKNLSATVYVAVEQANTAFGQRYFPVVAIAAILLLATLLVMNRRDKRLNAWLIGTSLLLVVAAVGFTATKVLPLNSIIDAWPVQSPPSDWQEVRDAWHNGQRIRTLMALPAFMILSAALLRVKPERQLPA